MKKLSKIFAVSLCLLLAFVVTTGCGSKKSESSNEGGNGSSSSKKDTGSKGNCTVFECIDKAETDDTYEDMNDLIGFEGESVREGDGWKTYKWELNDDESIEATFFKTSTTIKANFKDEKIKNKKVDFSKYDEVKKALNKGEAVSYDDLKEKFGGVDGTMTEKSSSGFTYRWVNSQGGYMSANLNSSKTKCSMIMGRI